MNVETGQIKPESELTEAEKRSGKWVMLPNGVKYITHKSMSKSELKREEYMERVRQKNLEGVNV